MPKLISTAALGLFVLVARLQGADSAPSTPDATPAPAASASPAASPDSQDSEPTPTPNPNLVPLPNPADIPSTQESTEESVLPHEPVIELPDKSVLPDADVMRQVQPLPENKTITFDSKLLNQAKDLQTFRKAKTATALDPAIADLKTRAFAAKTEREKRELLRQYYKERQAAILKGHPDIAINTNQWANVKLYFVSRPRTEPETATAELPAAIKAKRAKAAAATLAARTKSG